MKKAKSGLRYNQGARPRVPAAGARANASTEYRTRIELIQDLYFPASSSHIRFTPDGQHLIAAGKYAPRIKIFDLHQASAEPRCCRLLPVLMRTAAVAAQTRSWR